MKGFEYLVKLVKAYGIDHIFYCEAMMSRFLFEAEKTGVKRIMAHSENGAGYMADGYARASGKVGICMAQSIGAANLAGGIFDAHLANSPVIAITGKKTPDFQYRAAYQEADHRLLYEGITKFNADITDGCQLANVMRQSFREAVSGRPGPVHLDMTDNLGGIIEMAEIDQPVFADEDYAIYPPYRPSAEIKRVRAAAKLINEAKKPVLVIGRGAVYSSAQDEVIKLAAKADIPIVTTPDGKTIVDEDHPLWSGIAGLYGTGCGNKTVAAADLVIFVGTRASDQTTCNYTIPKNNVNKIQIDIDPTEIGRNFPNVLGLQGDAKTVLGQLLEVLEDARHPTWRDEVNGYVSYIKENYEKLQKLDTEIIRTERLCREVSENLPGDAVLVSDTGYSAVWSATMIKMRASQMYLRAAGSLGWSLPAAIGAKCALPERPVFCFLGDGAFYYHLSEMETAIRNNIPFVAIVNNNGAFVQVKEYIYPLFSDPQKDQYAKHCEFAATNYSEITKAMGCFSKRVTKADEIGAAIKEAIRSNRPAVVEVVTDPRYFAPSPKDPQF